MKYPVRKKKTIDIVRVGQQPYTVKEAQDKLESRLPELKASVREVENSAAKNVEATANFRPSTQDRARETGKFEKFQRAQDYLGGPRQTDGEKIASSFIGDKIAPFARQGAIETTIKSIDEKEGSVLIGKMGKQQEMIDGADAQINRAIFENKSNSDAMEKDAPVRWQDALERGDRLEANRIQDKWIDETIKLAEQNAMKDAEQKAAREKSSRDTIKDELRSFGIKKFRRMK